MMIVQIVSKGLAAVVLLIALFCVGSQAQGSLPYVPCPSVFKYERSQGQIIGVITLKDVTYGVTTIEADFSIPGNIHFDEDAGSISLGFHKDKIFEYIESGRPIPFRVVFPVQGVIPRLIAIGVNGFIICSGQSDPPPNSIYNMQYTMTATSNQPVQPRRYGNYQNFFGNVHPNIHDSTEAGFNTHLSNHLQGQSVPFWVPRMGGFNAPNMFPSHILPAIPRTNMVHNLEYICGQESNTLINLVVNGNTVDRPQYPWIVAIYKSLPRVWRYHCGGNLISSRIVLSAAHCFKENSKTIPTEDVLFFFGVLKLSDARNAVNATAQKIILHPDFGTRTNNIDADIAIVQLKDHVGFSHNIRPICLTQDSIDDHEGIVVGWGEDESHTGPSNDLKMVRTLVVSESQCVRSNPDLLFVTSNRTLCAGYRNGSGPCRGDSGSGLMVQIGNKWMLRGIVSRSLASGSTNCDLSLYSIFTDVVKFLEWIEENMLP